MNESRSRQPRVSAEAAYVKAHFEAQELVERIQGLLTDLPAPDNDEHPIDWTHVGTIGEVNRRLAAVVAFLSGTEQ